MLERLHEHISLELQVNTRTDTIFVVTAVIFNFVMLGIGSAMAGQAADPGNDPTTPTIVLFIALGLDLLVNAITIAGLLTGRETRQKLQAGLFKMYRDAEVDQYYDATLLTNYMRRYTLFAGIVGLLGLATLSIPLVILLTE